MKDRFGISVVIVNWNSKSDLAECLTSLNGQIDRSFRTIVVDNGSTDGSIQMLRSKFPDVTVVATGENLGFAEGCNRGIGVSYAPWVARLNNDAVAAPNWIGELGAAERSGAVNLGMLQSRIVLRRKPDRTNSTGVLIYRDGGFIDRGYNEQINLNEASEEIFCVSAGAALYRRAMLDQIRLDSGYFDRTFFMYFEDVDLGWRGRLAGWSAVYAPTAIVHHALYGTSSRRGQWFVRLSCNKNRVRTLAKNGSVGYVVRCAPRMLGEFVWSVAKIGWKAVPEYWAAVRDGMSQRKEVDRLIRQDRRLIEDRWITD
jgi:GT2 family glycosyltransferase